MSIQAKAVIVLWVLSAACQIATCVILMRRGLLRGWMLAILGLLLNGGKSVALMATWLLLGYRAYSQAWMVTRWVHWVAILLLLLQALWALSRVWPEGRPFAVMVGSVVSLFAAFAAVVQAGWIEWPGQVGLAVIASRSFSLAALLFVFWCGWIYRCLKVVTRNAMLWRSGLEVALCIEVACFAVEAASQRGPWMVSAQLAKQTAYMAAAWFWWRMGEAGEAYTLPSASDMPDRAWMVLKRWMENERRVAT